MVRPCPKTKVKTPAVTLLVTWFWYNAQTQLVGEGFCRADKISPPRILGRPAGVQAEPRVAVDDAAVGGVVGVAGRVPEPVDHGDLALDLVLVARRRHAVRRGRGLSAAPDPGIELGGRIAVASIRVRMVVVVGPTTAAPRPAFLGADQVPDQIRSIPKRPDLVLHDTLQQSLLLEDHLSLLLVVVGALASVLAPPRRPLVLAGGLAVQLLVPPFFFTGGALGPAPRVLVPGALVLDEEEDE